MFWQRNKKDSPNITFKMSGYIFRGIYSAIFMFTSLFNKSQPLNKDFTALEANSFHEGQTSMIEGLLTSRVDNRARLFKINDIVS